MILIADSGSTKTRWVLADKVSGSLQTCTTQGINPFFQTTDEILKTLTSEFDLAGDKIEEVAFYGAGCANAQKNKIVEDALRKFFATGNILVASDLLGAARSLCLHSKGMAAILGTGSNSCLYDGKDIIKNVSPLGFILGDEGSGAVMGRKLVSDVLKNQLPKELIDRFSDFCGQTAAEIMDNVYRKPFPNRYLATFTVFLSKNINEKPLHNLVRASFKEFFERNIRQYSEETEIKTIHFTGSIAWHFNDVLQLAANECGYEIGRVIKDPIEGLLEYHVLQYCPPI